MQVVSSMISPAQAVPKTPQISQQDVALTHAPPVADQTSKVIFQNFDTPTRATPQSVVQAQIQDMKTQPSIEQNVAGEHALEQQAQAAARRKSIMEMLPTSPTEVTKLMSALAAATSAEAIADIKLDALPAD
jgi:hypothetical protein